MRRPVRGMVVGFVVLGQVVLAGTAFAYTSETIWEDSTYEAEVAQTESEADTAEEPPWVGSNYCAALNDPETRPYVSPVDGYQCEAPPPPPPPPCHPWPQCQTSGPAGEEVTVTTTENGEGSGGEASASGCRTVDVGVDAWTAYGHHAWDFHLVKRWCWDHPRITEVNVGTYIHIDPEDTCCFVYHGASGYGWYYQWIEGRNRSGHYSFRQGEVANCVLRFGCISTKYPLIKIWSRADGTWRFRVCCAN